MLENNSQCYFAEHNMKAFAANMIISGCQTFMRANHIKYIDTLESTFTELRNRIPSPEMVEFITEFILDTVPDWVRVIICFENYMKAVLLAEGYLIHKVNREEFAVKSLSNQQNRKPVSINTFIDIISFTQDISTKKWVLEGLKEQTLNFNVLLRPKYQEVIKLPEYIIEVVQEINDKRNNLHFYHEAKNSYSPDFFLSLRSMLTFVQDEMMGKVARLESELKISRTQIPNIARG